MMILILLLQTPVPPTPTPLPDIVDPIIDMPEFGLWPIAGNAIQTWNTLPTEMTMILQGIILVLIVMAAVGMLLALARTITGTNSRNEEE